MDLRKTFNLKYNAEHSRLKGWDYSTSGYYFVTICTKDRFRYFGEIVKDEGEEAYLRATEIAEVAKAYWRDIPKHFPFVEVDEFILMPDHLHGILVINNPYQSKWQSNALGPQHGNLPAIIRGYKSSVKKYANDNVIEFVWQPKYYDHIMRDENAYHKVCVYIKSNPQTWLDTAGEEDEFLSSLTGKH